eukprot:CAMPEP_0172312996 /NCGR_PEP_ID=MMETSP1058-20130122/19065_1 /TAXON_ID=83371 /ORGANISM="Detonula confervacea, Strain CCMP 353" /LENGTH=523 /DNA_ID=CAMNT_0013026571 /DNA_START=50 /DNA_END=1621 /DNA_ORIENTATION=-
MVKIGKLFSKMKLDDASSVMSKFTGKTSPATLPPVNGITPVDAPVDAAHPAATKSRIRKGKSKSPTPTSDAVAETRDEPPTTSADPSDHEFPVSDADEQSFDDSLVSPSDDASATCEGTVETYDEELTQVSTEEKSYDDGDEDYTYDETATNQETNTVISVNTAKGNEMSKKYFHKDVVLNSLEDGANSLVIRAMYFIPKPKAEDHVVVKIEASTISARDCMKCRGVGLTKADLPFVPGYEVVGTIQALGNKVKADGQFRDGDRVAGVSTFGGGNSRFISIPATRLTKFTNNVKSTQAVCMIHDYMAALKALRLAKKSGSPFTGMNILVTDGFSPVGQAIINLASMEGAEIYCCADESKHSYLASLGAKCFVKSPEAWLPTATGTFDVVIDNSCTDSYSSSWFALNAKGMLVCMSPVYNIDNDELPHAACGLVEITELQQKWAGIKAKYMMSQTCFMNTATAYDDDREQYKQDLRYLMFLLERGEVKPKVAERVSLEDVPDAQRLMQSGRANGTVVCVPWIEE